MKIKRQELYNLVWAEPMTTICKRYGLSDNGLRKHCKTPFHVRIVKNLKQSIDQFFFGNFEV